MTEKAQAELLDDVLSRYEGSSEPARPRDLRGRDPPPARVRRRGQPHSRRVVRRHPVPDRRRPDVRRRPPGVHPAVRHARHLDARRDDHLRRGRGRHREHRARAVPRAGLADACTGETMLVDPDEGDRVVIRGTITDVDGKPVAGATLDCWQNATARVLRGAAAGHPVPSSTCAASTRPTTTARYEIRTVRPVPYPIPSDGPAGDMLKANNRDWMRPGHTHIWVRRRRLQGPHHPRVRRGERVPRRRRRCSASATASSDRSSLTPPASWPRRSTSVLERA